jgi:hypothetical protein
MSRRPRVEPRAMQTELAGRARREVRRALPSALLVCMLFGSGASSVACRAEAPGERRVLAASSPEPFIAFEREFQAFRSWERFELGASAAQGTTHVEGDRRVFLNARPEAPSERFPVGTIIVKELMSGADRGHRLFAMVKRGGGYNRRGALGWEWLELFERGDGSVGVNWRGVDAPSDETYSGPVDGPASDPLGGCNGCHASATLNDYVKSRPLRLAELAVPSPPGASSVAASATGASR